MNERGVTLLELLIATMLGSVVLLGIGSFSVATLRSSRQDSAQILLQSQGSLLIEALANEIRPATALHDNCNGGNSLQVTNTSGTSCLYLDSSSAKLHKGSNNLLGGFPSLTVSNFTSDCIRDSSNPPACINDPSNPANGFVGVTITFQLQDQAQNSMTFRTALRRL